MASDHQWRACSIISSISTIVLAFLVGCLFSQFYFIRDSAPSMTTNEFRSKPLNKNEKPSVNPSISPNANSLESLLSSPLPPSPSLASTKPQYEDRFFNFTELVQKFELAKVFHSPISPSDHSWCTQKYHRSRPTGLLYIKMPKAASSTMAGIALRIAHRVSSRIFGEKSVCSVQNGHVPKLNKIGTLFSNRDRRRSFLFSTLRNPANRAISRIFFGLREVPNGGGNKLLLKKLNTTGTDHQFGTVDLKRGGFQLAYTIMNISEEVSVYDPSYPTKILNPDLVASLVRRILKDYDFMIIVERFDECIVLMQLLLGLETSDIMYMSAKKGGSYYLKTDKCLKIVKSFKSPEIANFISTKEWYAKNYGDYLLIEAASQSIDLTIDAIGRERFEEGFEVFQNLKKRAQEECKKKVIFPCNTEGQFQEESISNCYSKDAGCGFPCLDAMKP